MRVGRIVKITALVAVVLVVAGIAAASISETALAPNDFAFTTDVELNHRSLRTLAARLKARPGDVLHIAFGHQGPVDGLDPLLNWASESGALSSGNVTR
jgi:hypothetical protein